MPDAPSSQIDGEARALLRKWTRCQYYVYLRPLDNRFNDPRGEFMVHWAVTVERRGVGWQQHRAEGLNLSEVIKRLGEEVPIDKPKLPPRQSPPRPTETRQIVVKERPPVRKKRPLLPKEERRKLEVSEEAYRRKRRMKQRANRK
jgi:hypothetical protein